MAKELILLGLLVLMGMLTTSVHCVAVESDERIVERLRSLVSDRESFLKLICPQGPAQCDEKDLPGRTSQFVESLVKELLPLRQQGRLRPARSHEKQTSNDMPWWRFLPRYIGKITQGNALPTFATNCFDRVDVNVQPGLVADQFVQVTVHFHNQTVEPLCQERLWFTLGAESETLNVEFEGKFKVFFNATTFDSFQRWDLETKGVRVFVFNNTWFDMFSDILDTALLFAPMLTGKLDPVSMADNMAFMNAYSEIKPFIVPRPNSTVWIPDPSLINNGDLLFQSSMDGLGPTIAWPTGTTANHVAVFLRDTLFGDLNVCESNEKGVICTAYQEWFATADKKGAATVWMPLAPELAASFNNAQAWNWIWTQVGLDYGYNTFLFGWLDTREDNYPCLPSDFKTCLVWEHVEWFALNLQKLSSDLATEFAGQALNHRLNTTGLTIPELFRYAEVNLSIAPGDIIAIPEQDSWEYQTKKDGFPYTGKSMVCSVLACHVLRQGGVFSNISGNLECGEQTPYDMSSMKIFDENKFGSHRPQACINQDPTNELCQLTGPFTFHLNYGKNSRPIYPQMGNHCASKNPEYKHSSNC